eukprot:Em0001g2944a
MGHLSFEDWILSKVDLTCRRILFLWRNSPCVSGSSSKLAKDSAFHHFTLLLCADTANMTTLLRPAPLLPLTNTSATLSRRSSTLNLSSRSHDITWDAACSHIASAFYSAHDITLTNQVTQLTTPPYLSQ